MADQKKSSLNKGVILVSRPGENNPPQIENFAVKEFGLLSDIPECKEGQIVVKTLYLSVDPYMRCRMNATTGAEYIPSWQVGEVASGGGVGQVIVSQCQGISSGDIVQSTGFQWPWMEVACMNASEVQKVEESFLQEHSSLSLGILGLPGLTSLLGIQEMSHIRPGHNQTLVVSGAAGACGSIAGQIGKLEGCSRVVGICGSDEKCKYLTEELGFDAAVNYKSEKPIKEQIRLFCPQGVDAYFDNVGGSVTDEVLQCMNKNSHIVLCGQIAVYNKDVPYPPPLSETSAALLKEMNICRERFLVLNYMDRFHAGLKQLSEWVIAGKLKYKETITEGVENTGKAFVSMMEGGNIGKQLVRA